MGRQAHQLHRKAAEVDCITPYSVIAELLSEQPDPAAMAILRRAASTCLRSGGSVKFGRCLRLPSAKQIRRESRDFAIGDALRLVPGATGYARAQTLHRLLTDMASRGVWHRWRAQNGAPADATRLQHLIFLVLSSGSNPNSPAPDSLSTLRTHAAKMFP